MPGLIRGVARTAAIAGTATAVSNRVSRRQAGRWAEQDQAAYAQQAPPQQAPPPLRRPIRSPSSRSSASSATAASSPTRSSRPRRPRSSAAEDAARPAPGDQSKTIAWRTASPRARRSKPSLISSSASRWVSRRSTGSRPCAVQVDEARDVARRDARAEVGALSVRSSATSETAGIVSIWLGVREADGDGRAAAAGGRVGLGEHGFALPTVSIAWSAPPPVSSRTSRDGVRRRRRRRRSRRARGRARASRATTSTATIVAAPCEHRAEQRGEADAAEAEDRDALARLRSAAALTTAPTPVSTAQPNSAAISNGSSGSTFTAERSETTMWSAKAETPRWWLSVVAVRVAEAALAAEQRAGGVGRGARLAQRGAPGRHGSQSPQAGTNARTTWSPAREAVDVRRRPRRPRRPPRGRAPSASRAAASRRSPRGRSGRGRRRATRTSSSPGPGRVELELARSRAAATRRRARGAHLAQDGACGPSSRCLARPSRSRQSRSPSGIGTGRRVSAVDEDVHEPALRPTAPRRPPRTGRSRSGRSSCRACRRAARPRRPRGS